MRFAANAAVTAFLAASLLVPAAAAPARTVSGDVVVSPRDPAVRIRLSKDLHYVGTRRFVLRDRRLGAFDDCQLYAFVKPRQGALRSLTWVQFEAYRPGHPELHHTYDSPRHATIGGLDFYVDTWVSAGMARPEPGSDEEQFYALLAAHGYARVPMMFVRLVHLTDATKRKELMIIHGEELPSGLRAGDLQKGGAAYARWPAIERELIGRTEDGIAISAVPIRP
ncbi:MAG: hypothetical protein KGJ78_16570 [Alphaproteobacteria bacterium]|nr:hypothetical protein [Alphaproteobacteria bacterium]